MDFCPNNRQTRDEHDNVAGVYSVCAFGERILDD
jgi:hypothetical protein